MRNTETTPLVIVLINAHQHNTPSYVRLLKQMQMDLVSASTEKLQPLPESSSQLHTFSEKEEKEWLEDVTEKAGRGEHR